MPRSGTRKCLNCSTFFVPHPRSKGRQRFCSHSGCQAASKRHSQKKWLNKSQNRDYFSGSDNVQRVQRWRRQNPGYWKKRRSCPGTELPLQDVLSSQVTESNGQNGFYDVSALQDLLISQPFVLLGLIAQFTGHVLQEDMAGTLRQLQQLGEDLLHSPTPGGTSYANSRFTQSSAAPPGAGSVQLGRPPSG